MDQFNDNLKCSDNIHLMTNDDLSNRYYLNTNGDDNDCIFNTLLNIFSFENSEENEKFRNYFIHDYYFLSLIDKINNEFDIVFYLLSKAIYFIENNKCIYTMKFNDFFNVQFIFDKNNCYPTLKLSQDKDKNIKRFKQFTCLCFLFSSLHRLKGIMNLKINRSNKITVILNEAEIQILNHIALIDSGFLNTSNSISERNLTSESSLLPFIIGNEDNSIIIFELATLLFQKYGFDSSVPSGFYSVFGNVLMNIHYYIIKYPIESHSHQLLLTTLYQLMAIKISDSSIKYPIVALITKLPTWKIDFVTDAMGKEFERLTFLGTFISGSMFADDDSEIAINHFKDENIHEMQIISEQKSLQSKLETIWDIQFQIVKLLLVEKSSHDMMIEYLNQALCVNATRGQMQPEESIASGEGFITNINAVLHRLVSPIKLDRVDVNFLTVNLFAKKEFNLGKLLSEETRIFFDSTSLKDQFELLSADRKLEDPVNFHTNLFYLSAVSHHYGVVASIRKQSRRSNAIQSLERSVSEITRLLDSNQFNKSQIEMHKKTLNRYKSMISYQKRAILCSQVILLHDTYLRSSLEFFIQVAKVLSSTIGSDISTLGSPILIASHSFSCMPQFLLDDLADFMLFVMSKKPNIFNYVNDLFDLCSFIIFISTHSHLIKSPYLVAKFVEIIFSWLPSVNNDSSLRPLLQCFLNHYSVTSGFLTNRLIQFYIEVEKTGASSEFYDKFSIRFKISIIFRSLWKHNNQMKIHLLNEVANNLDQFVKFINRAMNDMVYLLDESITALKRIRTNQEKKNDKQQWLQCSRVEQTTILQQLIHDERSTKSQLTLADVTVEMLYDFTHEIKDPFLCSELVEKLAAMLNSFLLELVGPKCRDLKVNEPEKYNWDPKKLLQNIIRIYLNLDSPTLIEAISNEERFYSSELFVNALSKLDNYNIICKHELEHLDIFRQKIETLVKQRENEEAFSDNIPAEYLDPIMSCIMKEPVMLPQSRTIVDKSVIKRHLLNDDCDPFNRQPLKLEDLIPQPELQKEIQDWKLNRLNNKK